VRCRRVVFPAAVVGGARVQFCRPAASDAGGPLRLSAVVPRTSCSGRALASRPATRRSAS
jgi:hypothetical protein